MYFFNYDIVYIVLASCGASYFSWIKEMYNMKYI